METDERAVHLVGSIPADNAEQAMRTAVERLGEHLRTLPDGETGERRNWIVNIIESLRTHPDLAVTRRGDWADYERIPRLKVRPGHRLSGDTLDFGHVATFEETFPVFGQIRTASEHDELSFQMGIPGDLDKALFTLGPVMGFRHRQAFTAATNRRP